MGTGVEAATGIGTTGATTRFNGVRACAGERGPPTRRS